MRPVLVKNVEVSLLKTTFPNWPYTCSEWVKDDIFGGRNLYWKKNGTCSHSGYEFFRQPYKKEHKNESKRKKSS